MAGSGSSIQKQWDIGQSIFLIGVTAIALLKAGSEDDIQPQAIVALEGLGAGLLVHKDRIDEAVDALKGNENRRLSKLMLSIGLNHGGVARIMRKSVPCVASFLLAVACKTCFTDRETGSMLYEMMDLRGVLRTVPVSRGQIEQAVGAFSGYGYKIVPSNLFNVVASKIRNHLTHSSDLSGLFCSSKTRELAEILSNVFEALQDMKVKKITLEGHQTGVWLVSVLMWLLPDEVEILLHGSRIIGTPESRVKMTLRKIDDGGWHIKRWYQEQAIFELIVGGVDKVPTSQHRALPLTHLPARSARMSLAAAYGMSDDAIEATGQVAAALVDIVFEHGFLHVDKGHGNFQVAFRNICQDHFISGYHTITKIFGWNLDAEFVKNGQHRIMVAYQRWKDAIGRDNGSSPSIGHGLSTNLVPNVTQLFLQIENQFFEDNGFSMIRENNLEHMGIVDPVIHVTAEALYGSIFEKVPIERNFRPLTVTNLRSNARVLWQLLCSSPAGSANQLQEFRAEAIRSVLPGFPQINTANLAVVSNGLVAYSAPLAQISTAKRHSAAISIMPGMLRWGDDKAPFDRIEEADAAEFPSSQSFYERTEHVEAFSNGAYLGLEARSSPEVANIETLISPSGKTLMLTTYLTSTKLQDAPVAVNWWRSIDALTFAEHVDDHDMTAFGEECLARSWDEERFFDSISWLGVGGSTSMSSIDRYVCMTSSDETVRFFEAGRLFDSRRVVIRQSAPLIRCLKVALDLGEQWAIIA
ncbi:MAG: hypothetical protein Q9195_009056 [Heterodermia aff. obscurata]